MEPIDILWGWSRIAAALGIDVKTAQALERDDGLPVIRRRGKTVQTTRALLKEWAENREPKEDPNQTERQTA